VNRVDYWTDSSNYDIDTAEAMYQTKRWLYVGFLCHQSIEKIIKAYYVDQKNEMPPKIHNLYRLSSDCGLYPQFSTDQQDFLSILEPLNIEGRYPQYKDRIFKSLSPTRCREIMDQTIALKKWIFEKLKK
jgi:HEPN domain-containing protein